MPLPFPAPVKGILMANRTGLAAPPGGYLRSRAHEVALDLLQMQNIDCERTLPLPFEKRNTAHLQSRPYYLPYRISIGLPSLEPGTDAHSRFTRFPMLSLLHPSGEWGQGGLPAGGMSQSDRYQREMEAACKRLSVWHISDNVSDKNGCERWMSHNFPPG